MLKVMHMCVSLHLVEIFFLHIIGELDDYIVYLRPKF